MLPSNIGVHFKEKYEERAAIIQFDGQMSRGMAEQASYSFMFSDNPEMIAPFVDEEEIKRQVYRASNIRRHAAKGITIMAREEQ